MSPWRQTVRARQDAAAAEGRPSPIGRDADGAMEEKANLQHSCHRWRRKSRQVATQSENGEKGEYRIHSATASVSSLLAFHQLWLFIWKQLPLEQKVQRMEQKLRNNDSYVKAYFHASPNKFIYKNICLIMIHIININTFCYIFSKEWCHLPILMTRVFHNVITSHD